MNQCKFVFFLSVVPVRCYELIVNNIFYSSRSIHGADSSRPAVCRLCELPYTEVISDATIAINIYLLFFCVCVVLLRQWPYKPSVPRPRIQTTINKFRNPQNERTWVVNPENLDLQAGE